MCGRDSDPVLLYFFSSWDYQLLHPCLMNSLSVQKRQPSSPETSFVKGLFTKSAPGWRLGTWILGMGGG